MTVVADPAANRPPEASFVFFPAGPVAGELITFVSTSADADSPIPASGPGLGPERRRSLRRRRGAELRRRPIAVAGTYTISLRIATNKTDVATLVLNVGAPGVPGTGVGQQALSLMSPFPVVRIAGQYSRRGVRIRRLDDRRAARHGGRAGCVAAGAGVRSSGCAAPSRCGCGQTGSSPPMRLLRTGLLEGRLLRPGVKLTLSVMRPGAIGPDTRFEIRRRRVAHPRRPVPGARERPPALRAPRADSPQPRLNGSRPPRRGGQPEPTGSQVGRRVLSMHRAERMRSRAGTSRRSPLRCVDGACCRGRACARIRERGLRLRLALGQRRELGTASSAGRAASRSVLLARRPLP